MSEPDGPRLGLERRMVAYYREMYQEHAPDQRSGMCPVCKRVGCEDYRFATASLIAAGEPLPEST